MKDKFELLLILAVLLVLNFVIVPIFEWQDTLISKTNQLERKLNKTKNAVLKSDQLLAENAMLNQQLAKLKSSIEQYEDVGKYQVEKQQQVEKLFADNNLNIRSLTWRDKVDSDLGAVLKVNVQFTGLVKDFIKVKMKLYGISSSISIETFGLNTRFQDDHSMGESTGNVLIVFSPLENRNVGN